MHELPQDLVDAFRRLGVEGPEQAARSQVNEGIPHLASASLMSWLWRFIVSHDDMSWVRAEIDSHNDLDSRKPGRGDVACPQGPVLERLLALGATRDDLTTLVRQMQIDLLSQCCSVFDLAAVPPPELPVTAFSAYTVGEGGMAEDQVYMGGMLNEFDHERRVRMAAYKRRK